MERHPSIPKKPLFGAWGRGFLGALALFAGGACAQDVPAAERRPDRPPPLVGVETARAGALRTELRFPAEVRPRARSAIASGADGAVVSVGVRVGDPVRKGSVLARIDDELPRARAAVARADRARAERQAALARTERDRLEQLRPGTVSDLERERARTAAAVAEAEALAARASLREREAELARFAVRAPYDGVVAARTVDPGDWVQPGDPILELVATSGVELIVEGSRILVGRVARGDAATIHASEEAEEALPARIVGIVPALDPISRTLRIRVVPDAAATPLVAGDAVEVGFDVELSETGVLVSTDALLDSPDEVRLFEIEEGVTVLRSVRVLGRSADVALVEAEGLAEGDTVVVRGNERLRPGQPVRIAAPTGG